MEEGIVHESLNLAKIQQVLCFSSLKIICLRVTCIFLRQPKDATSRFAVANGIPYDLVDGNDVIQVEMRQKRRLKPQRMVMVLAFWKLLPIVGTGMWIGEKILM